MASKCLECGNKITTNQEVQHAVYETVKGIGTFALNVLKAAPKLVKELILRGIGPKPGFAAGPLNSMDIKCPNCGATGRWQDV